MKYSILILASVAALATAANATSTIYSNIPDSLPGNVPSLGYEANQTAEFGNKINFDGTDRQLQSATVVMSDWASQADWITSGFTDPTGYDHNLTFNIYDVGAGDSVGSQIGSVTQLTHVPWKPVGFGFNGIAFATTFDFSSLNITLPNSVIFGLAYNTSDNGSNPTHQPGPYDSLNFGLATTAPSVGSNVDPDGAYWNTQTAGDYADGGAGGVGTFRKDTNWSPYGAMVSFQAVPEPAPILAMGLGVVVLLRRRRK